ncbi:hypothetical protein BDV93DRAFT_524474 [Ceratobasidium sp. AG-I]|nr:hypothetical protein BDV93DRAFT_524474 [Ceratobasidium sp. AG-I]
MSDLAPSPAPLATKTEAETSSNIESAKVVEFNATAPPFVPLVKQFPMDEANLKLTIEFRPRSDLPESESTEGIDVSATPEDVLSTPTPTSVSSFAQLVKAARDASEPQSSDVSMMSMTDDDSEISASDISITVEPKTPILSIHNAEIDDLDISPTGGVGGGVRCGISKPAESALTATTAEKVFEGLVPQKDSDALKAKYRPFPPQRSCNIHVQNLPSHYRDAELGALCGEFGRVVSVRVFRRPVQAPPNRRLPDGQHSTYGFVLFENVMAAENCVNTLRRRYKNIYPSFARQSAPAVHQPAFVGLLEAMAYGELHASDPTLGAYGYTHDVNPGPDLPFYDANMAGPMYGAAVYENPQMYEAMPTHAAPAYEATPEVQQPTLVSAPLEATPSRPRALTIRPMPPPIQSGVTPSTTTDRLNSVLNERSILLVVDGLPKDFGVGLLDTLFAPHAIHDVRLHRQGASGSVRSSVKVSNRLAALQSIEKLNGMQFAGLESGLRVRLAEEVPGERGDNDSNAAPGLPSYRTLPDVQEYRATLAPPKLGSSMAASTSAPAVSMLGSGLNALLFSSESSDALGSLKGSPSIQLSPATGRLLSPGRFHVPFTPPGLPASMSMPHIAPRFLSPAQSYGLLPSLRVGNVTVPITSLIGADPSLYAFSNASASNLQDKLPVPEPPVIKVTGYAGALKKSIVPAGSPENQKKKKRKSGRATKGRAKSDSEKASPEVEPKATLDVKAAVSEPVVDSSPEVVPEKSVQAAAQPKSAAFKAKKWLATRRRSNSKPAAVKI